MNTSTTTMPQVFVSPCGTSLLTNQAGELRKLLLDTANLKEHELSAEQHSQIAQHIQKRRAMLLDPSMGLNTIKTMSAELNGIITYHNNDFFQGVPEQHYVVVSDTYQGQQVGEMVVDWLQMQGLIASKLEIPDLATDDAETFRWAMSELIQWCDETLTGYREQGWNIVFNLTGGFKGVNGFLQTIAMFYAQESVYIFQSSSQLLRIPQLPVYLDKEGVVGEHLTAFRKLNMKLPVSQQQQEGIPGTLLLPMDHNIELSVWGELVWRQAKPAYYERELLPPLTPKLQYSDRFQREVRDLERDRVAIVNHRLDQLARYLESNGQYNPASLDFKQLRGNPFNDATHECDAWSDRDAKRLFGHFQDNGTFIVDWLGAHLPN